MRILFLLLFVSITMYPNAITYDLNGGRFGDCLSIYCKAKLFSCKYKLPLYYKSFEYSDQLVLHTQEQLFDDTVFSQFSKIVKVKTEEDIINCKDTNVLFVTNFYTKTPDLYDYQFVNPAFELTLKQMIKPVHPIIPFEQNNGDAHVALHVRKGGGFDKPLSQDLCGRKNNQPADQTWPTKFPTDQYYLEQLQRLRKLINPNISMLVHLFTDDPNPARIANCYQNYLQDATIQFTFRAEGNSHKNNVIEDFFAMAQCDYLIRSSSLYTKAVQMIGNHKIVIYPIYGKWNQEKQMPVMNPIGIVMRS